MLLTKLVAYNDNFHIQNNKTKQNIAWNFKKVVQKFTNSTKY